MQCSSVDPRTCMLAPIIFVVLNIFKTKQEYNMGSFWQLPHSFAVIDNFKNVVANKLFVYMDPVCYMR